MSRRANGEGSIYRRKDGRYVATATVRGDDGTYRRVHVYEHSRAAAATALQAIKAGQVAGAQRADQAPRLAEFLDRWLEEVVRATCQPKTVESYEYVVRLYLKPALGGWRLTELDVPTVQRAFNKYRDAGSSARMIGELRKVLSAALRQAERENLVERNVAALIRPPRYTPKEEQPWTASEVRTFLAAATGTDYYGPLLLIALYGLRRGESVGLRWCDVDFDQSVIRVRHQVQRLDHQLRLADVKTTASRRDLPLFGTAEAYLRGIKLPRCDSNDLIFTSSTGNLIEPGNLRRSFLIISRRAGLRRIRLHYLRHTAGTLLKTANAPVRDAQKILGHASPLTTLAIYQHSNLEAQHAALINVAGLLADNSARQPMLLSTLLSNEVWDVAKSLNNSGGPSETRTHDTLLKSFRDHPWYLDQTSVTQLVQTIRRQQLLGRAAVKLLSDCAANPNAPETSMTDLASAQTSKRGR